jgi:hypothetical protein
LDAVVSYPVVKYDIYELDGIFPGCDQALVASVGKICNRLILDNLSHSTCLEAAIFLRGLPCAMEKTWINFPTLTDSGLPRRTKRSAI